MDKRNGESNILEFSSKQPTPVRSFDLSGGGGGYSLGWPIRGGPARKGTLYMKGYGFYMLKREGKSVFGSVKGSKGLTDEFYGFIKSKKRCIFVIDSYHLKDSAFKAVKGMQSSKQGM